MLGQALPAHLVGGCGARAVSRKTPIYFILFIKQVWHKWLCSWGQLCNDQARGRLELVYRISCFAITPTRLKKEANSYTCSWKYHNIATFQVPASCCAHSTNVAECQKSPTGANGAHTIGCWALIQVFFRHQSHMKSTINLQVKSMLTAFMIWVIYNLPNGLRVMFFSRERLSITRTQLAEYLLRWMSYSINHH